MPAERDLAVEQRRDQEGVGGGDGGGLGRGGDAGVDEAEQHDRHHQRREGADGDAGKLAERDPVADREVPAAGDQRDDRHLRGPISRPGTTPAMKR